MILGRKLKVCQSNGDEGSDNYEDDKYNEEDGVYGVHLVAPDASKNVVKLYVNGRERQEASHAHLWNS